MKTTKLIVGAILVACCCLASAGSTAASQAQALYVAMHKQDWKALYHLAAFSPAVKNQLQGPDKFATDVQSGINQTGNAKVVKQLFDSIHNIKVGAAAVNGNRATVPTSADLTINGKTTHFQGVAKMIKDGGVWKWDLAYTDDVEKATSESLQQLLGKPVGK